MREKKERKEKKKSAYRSVVEQIKKNKAAFIVYAVLRALVIFVLIRSVFIGEWESVFTCSLALILLLVPPIVEKSLNIQLPTGLEITVYIFVFCAEILGEIGCYYLKFPFWDTTLHTTSGFMFAAFGFCLLDIHNRNKKVNFTPLTLTLMAFCFSMTIGVLWEFFEFGADFLLATDMQKDTVINVISSVNFDPTMQNKAVVLKDIVKTTIETADGTITAINGYLDIGIIDTMKDLFVNFIGAIVFCTFGYIYIIHRGGKHIQKVVESFVPTVEE